MPAAARSPVTGRAAGRVFGATETPRFGTTMSAPIESLVGLLCASILMTKFASRVRFPVSESLCTPKLDQCTFRALYLAWCPECKLGRKSHVEKSWDPPGPTEPDLAPLWRRAPTHRVPRFRTRARLVVLRARFGSRKMVMLLASTQRASKIPARNYARDCVVATGLVQDSQ